MKNENEPSMKVPLGLSVASEPTFGELMDRAEKRIRLIASGKKELDFAVEKAFITGTRLKVIDGKYEINAQIPVKAQTDFVGHGGDDNFHAEGLRRSDEDEQQAIDEVVSVAQSSSQLLDRVADAMAKSPDLLKELRLIEIKEHVDTRPARSHIYYGQEEFTLDVDNELITFQAHNAVRSAIADDNPVNVVMTVVGSRSESIVLRGFVKITQSSVKSSGLQAGGAVHHFRFIRLEGWQKTLLEAACWLQLPICLVATETVSTYTLQQMPADVLEVQNWDDLLEWTLSAIWRIREAKNEASLQDRRDAA